MTDTSFVESDERHAIVISFSKEDQPLLSVYDDVLEVEDFAKRFRFDTVSVLQDSNSTTKAVLDLL